MKSFKQKRQDEYEQMLEDVRHAVREGMSQALNHASLLNKIADLKSRLTALQAAYTKAVGPLDKGVRLQPGVKEYADSLRGEDRLEPRNDGMARRRGENTGNIR